MTMERDDVIEAMWAEYFARTGKRLSIHGINAALACADAGRPEAAASAQRFILGNVHVEAYPTARALRVLRRMRFARFRGVMRRTRGPAPAAGSA